MKKKHYADGGETDPMLEAKASSESQDTSRSMGSGPKDEEAPKVEKKQSFKEAFAEARKGGGKSFEWNGKKYTTELASSAPAKEKPVNVTQSKEYAPGTSILDRSKADREALVNLGLKRQEGERAVKEFKAKQASGMKSGGSVSSASKRGDGIASKGKTKGTMVAMCGGGMYKGKK